MLAMLCGIVIFFSISMTDQPEVDARTVITVGSEPLTGFALQNITTNGSGFATVSVDSLESPVAIGSGLSLRNYSGVLQQSDDDGATWTAIGETSGGAAIYALKTSAHTGIMASLSTTWGDTWEGDIQLAAQVKRDDLGTAEDMLSLYSSTYGCHLWQFGFDSSNHARLTYVTEMQGSSPNYTCVTTTITSTETYPADQWVEVAFQRTGSTVYFYKNGVVESSKSGATMLNVGTGENVTARLFEGFQGLAASLKIGTALTWPTTGARLIDTNGEMTPGAFWLFPFREGTGATTADVVTGTSFTLNDATWETITPYLF